MVEDATGMTLRDALQDRVIEPLGLEQTDLVEGRFTGDCARGYLPANNPLIPGPGPVDVTEIDLSPVTWAGGGVASTAGDTARVLEAVLGGGFLPDRLRDEMLDAVESAADDQEWHETDRYGLGIGEITAVMGRERSSCGPAWGHLGFSPGYMAIAISSEDGARQVVVCANGTPTSQETEDAFFDAAGRLIWDLYCM
jgi:D-alanyl-D-alanine carboxypeptidase